MSLSVRPYLPLFASKPTGPGGIVLLEDMLVIQDALVSAGLAWVDDRYCKLPVCDLWRLHQREARAARRGLWADPDPVPPWTWRKMQRTKHKK